MPDFSIATFYIGTCLPYNFAVTPNYEPQFLWSWLALLILIRYKAVILDGTGHASPTFSSMYPCLKKLIFIH
jgi:hypothetical protein